MACRKKGKHASRHRAHATRTLTLPNGDKYIPLKKLITPTETEETTPSAEASADTPSAKAEPAAV